MTPFLFYLLKSAVCLILFYGLYILVLRRLTFFRWNRYYLLISLAISMLIPVLPSVRPVLQHTDEVVAVVNHTEASSDPAETGATPVVVNRPVAPIRWPEAAAFLYLAGVAFMLGMLVLNLWKVYRLIHNGKPIRYGKMFVIFSEDKIPTASFFSHVFIQKDGLSEQDISQVLAHEASHVKRLHSLDILFIELVKVIWWFNPFVYFLKNSLQEVHEYEADQDVCIQYDRKDYASLLLRLGTPLNLSMANMFSLHPLKDRLKMLFGKHSRFSQKWLYVLLLPLALAACEQFGKRFNDREKEILTSQPGFTALIIDGTTGLQRIEEAADTLRAREDVDLRVVTYQKDSSGEIADLQIDVKAPNGLSLSGWWDNDSAYWEKYRAIFIVQNDLDGKPGYTTGDTKIANTADLEMLKQTFMPPLKEGKKLFQTNCASCHHPLKDMTDPALAGITDRYSKAWIRDFVHNSATLVANGDTAAMRLYNRWGKIPMTMFPDLKDNEIDNIFKYVDFYASAKNNPAP